MTKRKIVTTIAIILSICKLGYAGEPKVISSYDELAQLLTHGHQIFAIIDLYQCKSNESPKSSWATDKKTKDQLISNFNFKHFIIYPSKGIHANTILAYDNYLENTVREGMVNIDVQLEVHMNNDVKITGQSFDPATYKPLHDKSSYICHISQPYNMQGITLYDYN